MTTLVPTNKLVLTLRLINPSMGQGHIEQLHKTLFGEKLSGSVSIYRVAMMAQTVAKAKGVNLASIPKLAKLATVQTQAVVTGPKRYQVDYSYTNNPRFRTYRDVSGVHVEVPDQAETPEGSEWKKAYAQLCKRFQTPEQIRLIIEIEWNDEALRMAAAIRLVEIEADDKVWERFWLDAAELAQAQTPEQLDKTCWTRNRMN